MNSTSVQSVQFSPIKDGRRILGEKDSNACLSPATHAKPSFPAIGTPVKRISIATSPKKLLPSPIFAGQKRTRDQLEEMEENLGYVQTRESSPQLGVQSTVNDDMQSQVSSCETDKEVPGNYQSKANPKCANNSSSKPPHHKTHNPNATKHKIKWTPTNLSMCPAPPSKKRVALSQTLTRENCSSNKYADLDISIKTPSLAGSF